MIVITGAAGFIGSYLAGWWADRERTDLVLVDDFSNTAKEPNWTARRHARRLDRDDAPDALTEMAPEIDAVVHLGARTDTLERDTTLLDRLNTRSTMSWWQFCTEHRIPFLYASSAAVYGSGHLGYREDADVGALAPLNAYGQSKLDADRHVLDQDAAPPAWAGFRFFNVYGPNEYHKGRMASVVLHATHQARSNGVVKLFRSHRADCADGEQTRDFIDVRDVARVIDHFVEHRPPSGIYNLGTGTDRSFNDLARAVFTALDRDGRIEYIDMPADLRDQYQYHTRADITKLRAAGYHANFTSLEDGVMRYIRRYLTTPGIH